MAAFPQTITSQQPVDLGGGFEDPMDPCTMCQQGQMEIQNAYNELTQSCNACQTQQNLRQLQTQGGCEGCQQAQKIIQNVQQQSTGCASCGTQPTVFSQVGMQPTGQTAQFVQQPLSAGQPMLMPLTGTSNQPLQTVQIQPGVMAGQLPIAIEMGPPMTPGQFTQLPFTTSPTSFQPQLMTSSGGMPSTQPMVVGGTMMTPSPVMQPSVMASIPQPVQQPTQPVNIIPAPVAPVMQQPIYVPPPAPPPPPPPPPPITQPAPINVIPTPPPPPPPTIPPIVLPPGFQNPYANLPGQGGIGGITGVGAGATGYGVGGGKAGPGSATTIGVGPEGLSYNFGSGFTVNIGGGITGVGAPGAFDIHRPDLHKGGGWHNTLPMGASEAIINLY